MDNEKALALVAELRVLEESYGDDGIGDIADRIEALAAEGQHDALQSAMQKLADSWQHSLDNHTLEDEERGMLLGCLGNLNMARLDALVATGAAGSGAVCDVARMPCDGVRLNSSTFGELTLCHHATNVSIGAASRHGKFDPPATSVSGET